MSDEAPSRASSDERSQSQLDYRQTEKSITTGKAKASKLGALKRLFKSPAVERYEKTVSQEQKDWGTGNKFGGGPYRPLAMTPGAADYYTAKGATGS